MLKQYDKLLKEISKLWAYPASLERTVAALKQVEGELEALRLQIRARYPEAFSE